MSLKDRVTPTKDLLQITGVSYRSHTKAKYIHLVPMTNPILANPGAL